MENGRESPMANYLRMILRRPSSKDGQPLVTTETCNSIIDSAIASGMSDHELNLLAWKLRYIRMKDFFRLFPQFNSREKCGPLAMTSADRLGFRKEAYKIDYEKGDPRAMSLAHRLGLHKGDYFRLTDCTKEDPNFLDSIERKISDFMKHSSPSALAPPDLVVTRIKFPLIDSDFECIGKIVERMLNLLADNDHRKQNFLEYRRVDPDPRRLRNENSWEPDFQLLDDASYLLEQICLQKKHTMEEINPYISTVASGVAYWVDVALIRYSRWYTEECLSHLKLSVQELMIMADDGNRKRLIDKVLMSVHSEARVCQVPKLVEIITYRCRIPLNPDLIILLECMIDVCIRIMNAEPEKYPLVSGDIFYYFQYQIHLKKEAWHHWDKIQREVQAIKFAHFLARNFRIPFLYEYPQVLAGWPLSRITALRRVISCFIYFDTYEVTDWEYGHINFYNLCKASEKQLNDAFFVLSSLSNRRFYRWHEWRVVQPSEWLNGFLQTPSTPYSLTVLSIMRFQALPGNMFEGIFVDLHQLLTPYLDFPIDYVEMLNNVPTRWKDELNLANCFDAVRFTRVLYQMEVNLGPNKPFVSLVYEFIASFSREKFPLYSTESLELVRDILAYGKYPKNLVLLSALFEQIKASRIEPGGYNFDRINVGELFS